jgi:hypothetical protein
MLKQLYQRLVALLHLAMPAFLLWLLWMLSVTQSSLLWVQFRVLAYLQRKGRFSETSGTP